MFFILSGFIITRSYSDKIRSLHEIARFLLPRAFRLYPMHISLMSIFVVYESTKAVASHLGFQINSFQYPTPARTLLPDLLLIESLTMPNLLTWKVPSWSISCEVSRTCWRGSGGVNEQALPPDLGDGRQQSPMQAFCVTRDLYLL
jgi:peptidoglycan/LPS O-acetylase OafA/YrhL